MRPSARAVRHLLTLGALAYFVLWACAPMTSGPPPVSMGEDQRARVGGSINGAVAPLEGGVGGSLSFYAGKKLEKQRELGLVLDAAFLSQLGSLGYFGVPVTPSGGIYYQRDRSDNPDLYWGFSASGGWIWASVGMPLAKQVREGMWLYTHPQVRYSLLGVVTIPVGVSKELRNSSRFTAEAGAQLGNEALVVPYVSVGVEKRF